MGNLSTPESVQKLQTALHAKAKADPGYRFYALYDKISRADFLAHAYAQCRSNKGAPGVDRQDFEAVEAYGVERWLGELALALRSRMQEICLSGSMRGGWLQLTAGVVLTGGGCRGRPGIVEKRQIGTHQVDDFGGVGAVGTGTLNVRLTAELVRERPPHAIGDQPAFDPEDDVSKECHPVGWPYVAAHPSRGRRVSVEKPNERPHALHASRRQAPNRACRRS